MYTRITGLVI